MIKINKIISSFLTVNNSPIVVSSDLNGTLVSEHTMSDMIQKYLSESDYHEAKHYFDDQTEGKVSLVTAFEKAAPLTSGLSLKNAIDYTLDYMTYVNGLDDFLGELSEQNIPLVINSTGYGVTIESIRFQKGTDMIHGCIGNHLKFMSEHGKIISDGGLAKLVKYYFSLFENFERPNPKCFNSIRSYGEIILDISNEYEKASSIMEYCRGNFKNIRPHQIIHIGDTMGDSMAILNVAKFGGTGIAFNYNKELKSFLEKEIKKNPKLLERIHFVDEKGTDSDIKNTLPIIFDLLAAYR